MKIAVALDGNQVSEHFGHCPAFYIADINDGKIENATVIDNPGHVPGFLPKFLAEKKVNCVITGGIGAKAIELFNMNNIDVISGARGNVEDVVKAFVEGKLVSTGSVCHQHLHAGECGEHH